MWYAKSNNPIAEFCLATSVTDGSIVHLTIIVSTISPIAMREREQTYKTSPGPAKVI